MWACVFFLLIGLPHRKTLCKTMEGGKRKELVLIAESHQIDFSINCNNGSTVCAYGLAQLHSQAAANEQKKKKKKSKVKKKNIKTQRRVESSRVEASGRRGGRSPSANPKQIPTMLPTTASKGRGAARSAPPLFGPYLRRIVKVRRSRISFPSSLISLFAGRITTCCRFRSLQFHVRVPLPPEMSALSHSPYHRFS